MRVTARQRPGARNSPLILTLLLDSSDQARFDRLRCLHFPPERNHLPAHVTLFHALPDDAAALIATLEPVRAATTACRLTVSGLRSLGRGVAFVLEPGPIGPVRSAIAREWQASLTAQDRQRWSPHVTIQNKASPAESAQLLEAMRAGFAPFEVGVQGLALWRYLGGPWEHVSEHRFRPCQDTRLPPDGRG